MNGKGLYSPPGTSNRALEAGLRLCWPDWVQGRKVQREHKVDRASCLGWLVRPALDS